MAPLYQFRPMTAADLPLLAALARRAACGANGGEIPDEQFGLVSGDLNEPRDGSVRGRAATNGPSRYLPML